MSADRQAIDIDPGLYAARYLRAWLLEAVLAETLRERFDEDWFENPRAGAFLAGLWAEGQSRDAEQIARESLGQPSSFERVARRFEEILR